MGLYKHVNILQRDCIKSGMERPYTCQLFWETTAYPDLCNSEINNPFDLVCGLPHCIPHKESSFFIGQQYLPAIHLWVSFLDTCAFSTTSPFPCLPCLHLPASTMLGLFRHPLGKSEGSDSQGRLKEKHCRPFRLPLFLPSLQSCVRFLLTDDQINLKEPGTLRYIVLLLCHNHWGLILHTRSHFHRSSTTVRKNQSITNTMKWLSFFQNPNQLLQQLRKFLFTPCVPLSCPGLFPLPPLPATGCLPSPMPLPLSLDPPLDEDIELILPCVNNHMALHAMFKVRSTTPVTWPTDVCLSCAWRGDTVETSRIF